MSTSTQLVIALAIALAFFTGGFEVATWRMKAQQLTAVDSALAAYKTAEAKTAQESAALNASNAKRNASTKIINTKLRADIDKNPDIAKCKLSADVVRDFDSLP